MIDIELELKKARVTALTRKAIPVIADSVNPCGTLVQAVGSFITGNYSEQQDLAQAVVALYRFDLLHQAGLSKHEYGEVIPTLRDQGHIPDESGFLERMIGN